jgi:hypothetical protein
MVPSVSLLPVPSKFIAEFGAPKYGPPASAVRTPPSGVVIPSLGPPVSPPVSPPVLPAFVVKLHTGPVVAPISQMILSFATICQ